jgi:hypothetical protein
LKKFIKLISDDRLSRQDASYLAQLRAGHFPINAYLERIGWAERVHCPACRHPREDVKHFLMDCPTYAHERWTLHQHCKMRNLTLKMILGKKKMAVPVANFIQATERFTQREENGGNSSRERAQGEDIRAAGTREDRGRNAGRGGQVEGRC